MEGCSSRESVRTGGGVLQGWVKEGCGLWWRAYNTEKRLGGEDPVPPRERSTAGGLGKGQEAGLKEGQASPLWAWSCHEPT